MSDEQVWMLLYEESSSSKFRLEHKTLSEVKEGEITFDMILRALDLDTSRSYTMWTTGPSIDMALVIPFEAAIFVMNTFFFRDDPSITIILRPKDNPSPGARQSPSELNSLQQRRRISGQNSLQNEECYLDAETVESIHELPGDEKVILDFGHGNCQTFRIGYLLSEFPD